MDAQASKQASGNYYYYFVLPKQDCSASPYEFCLPVAPKLSTNISKCGNRNDFFYLSRRELPKIELAKIVDEHGSQIIEELITSKVSTTTMLYNTQLANLFLVHVYVQLYRDRQ